MLKVLPPTGQNLKNSQGLSDLRQSFSSSPSPQLSWPLQRKMPGMQRLGWVHLNWLGRHTWMSGIKKKIRGQQKIWIITGTDKKGFEMLWKHVGVCLCTAVGLVRVVLAVIVSVTDVGWVGADACATLELARSALELSYSDRNST